MVDISSDYLVYFLANTGR